MATKKSVKNKAVKKGRLQEQAGGDYKRVFQEKAKIKYRKHVLSC